MQIVTKTGELAELAKALAGDAYITVDTEFMWGLFLDHVRCFRLVVSEALRLRCSILPT